MSGKLKKTLRAMPYNSDAEASVLGAILIDNKAADELIPILQEEDFYISQNRLIFSEMKKLQDQSKPIDTVSVADKLELAGKLEEVGNIIYLAELAECVPSAANGEYYAQIIKRDGLVRKVIGAGNDIAKFGYECDEGKLALENAEKLVYNIAEQSSEKALVKADDALAEAMKNIQDIQTGNVPKNTIHTGIPSLDQKTKGLKPGEMILLAARPSVGKTAFALNIASNVCLNQGKNVAVFSLEMPGSLLVKRMLAYVSGVSLTKMNMRGGLSTSDNAKIFKAYNSMLAAGLYIDDYSMNGPSEVLSKCRRLKREKGLDMIIIDYLQLMTTSGGKKSPESRQVEVSEMSRKIKIYAKELDVPILVLSQMSRSVEQRNDHTPLLSDLRESGSIEQDADVVMFLHNPSKYNPALPDNQVILDVKKNRNGPIGEITLEWNGDTTSFKECVDGAMPVSSQPVEYQVNKSVENTDFDFDKTNDKDNNSLDKNDIGISADKTENKRVENSDELPFGDITSEKVDKLPFDTENIPFNQVASDNLPFEDVPPPNDSDIPIQEFDEDDDEYVDDDGDLPFD